MSICIMLTAFCWSTLAALTDAHMAKTRHERALASAHWGRTSVCAVEE